MICDDIEFSFSFRLGVNFHFEKKSLKSALVKPENLRIAFKLIENVTFMMQNRQSILTVLHL